ncbi:hypothetical protein ACIS_01002 [Anaplasma centrale str. Israel]|uniref:Uncharacterized protein n=1 Tax=Anaplasma centrale (strain Israel) TaxID=574556 RepID=D1ASN8_ANACI|nr:hypothetical protein [Anaplasma centrale]ACZ49491.1 hypothetical protein ACIS_01002 [Anaplasma centrale str. Israel]
MKLWCVVIRAGEVVTLLSAKGYHLVWGGRGADLMSSGTTVSYGTSKGLRDIFVSARNRGHGAMSSNEA